MTISPSRHDSLRSADALPSRPWHLLVLSARSEASLEAMTRNLVEHLQRNRDLDIADVAFTLQVGRQLYGYQRIAVCRDLAEAIEALGGDGDARVHTIRNATKQPRIAFVFGGDTLPPRAARELYRTEPVFTREIDLLAEELRSSLGLDLRRLLDLSAGPQEEAGASPRDPGATQAACFASEYALAKVWRAWGVVPSAVMGYGTGEYACACAAGVIGLQVAMALAVMRARVLAGEVEQTAFVKLTKGLQHHPPLLPWVSSVTGAWMPETEAGDPSYWLRQLQWASPVAAGVQTLIADGIEVLLHIAPGEGLPDEASGAGEMTVQCLRLPPGSPARQSDQRWLAETLGHLYAAGVPIDWSAFYFGREPHRTPLPGYAFERRRCWFTAENPAGAEQPGAALHAQTPEGAQDRVPIARHDRRDFHGTHVAPRDEIEKTLVELCQTQLGIDAVGIYDNVMELGADSLFTMQLSRQIEQAFGTTISPHHLFVEPNIASLAGKIRERGGLNARPHHRREAKAADRTVPDRGILGDYDRILTFVEGLSEEQIDQMLRGMTD